MAQLDADTQRQIISFGVTLATDALQRHSNKRLQDMEAAEVLAAIRELEEKRVVVPTDDLLKGD